MGKYYGGVKKKVKGGHCRRYRYNDNIEALHVLYEEPKDDDDDGCDDDNNDIDWDDMEDKEWEKDDDDDDDVVDINAVQLFGISDKALSVRRKRIRIRRMRRRKGRVTEMIVEIKAAATRKGGRRLGEV